MSDWLYYFSILFLGITLSNVATEFLVLFFSWAIRKVRKDPLPTYTMPVDLPGLDFMRVMEELSKEKKLVETLGLEEKDKDKGEGGTGQYL